MPRLKVQEIEGDMGKLFLPLIQRCPPACVLLEKCPGAPLARGNAGEAALRDLGDAARKVILRQRVQVAGEKVQRFADEGSTFAVFSRSVSRPPVRCMPAHPHSPCAAR